MSNIGTIILILCVIIFIVIPGFKDKTIAVKKLAIGPAIFLYLFFDSLGKEYPLFAMSYYVIAGGVILGTLIGYATRVSAPVVGDKEKQTIFLKGSSFSLIIFLIIFAAHFVVGYLKSTNPSFFTAPSFANQFLLMVLALVSCLPLGSNICLYLKYRRT